MTEPLNGKYECYGQNLWWDKLAKQRLSTDASEVLEDVKLACEFYLRYKNHPELLVVEHEELIDEMLKNKLIDYKHARKGLIVYDEKYNEWLFKLAFKDVLDGGEKGGN